jgi:hypothetical protein
MMTIECFELDKHYRMLEDWAKKRSYPSMKKEFVPRVGYIVYNGPDPIAAAFLHQNDSGFATIADLIADPDSKVEDRSEALDFLISSLLETAKELGFTAVGAAAAIGKMVDRFVAHGFVVRETNVTHLYRRL